MGLKGLQEEPFHYLELVDHVVNGVLDLFVTAGGAGPRGGIMPALPVKPSMACLRKVSNPWAMRGSQAVLSPRLGAPAAPVSWQAKQAPLNTVSPSRGRRRLPQARPRRSQYLPDPWRYKPGQPGQYARRWPLSTCHRRQGRRRTEWRPPSRQPANSSVFNTLMYSQQALIIPRKRRDYNRIVTAI